MLIEDFLLLASKRRVKILHGSHVILHPTFVGFHHFNHLAHALRRGKFPEFLPVGPLLRRRRLHIFNKRVPSRLLLRVELEFVMKFSFAMLDPLGERVPIMPEVAVCRLVAAT